MNIYKKGFSLLELILVLGVGSAMAFLKFQDMKNEQEAIIAQAVGAQIKQVGEAVNRYIIIKYDKLSTLTSSSSQSSDPGPRICSAAGCEITYQTLINEGLLPSSYSGINAQKSSYKILLKRDGTTPNYVINGLVTTSNSWKESNKIRYDLLGKAMWAAGVDSGMTRTATVASGYQGQWSEKTAEYSNITAEGLLAYRVGYDSSMYSVYLRRDGTLPMTGDLNMGGQNINNAKEITASGDVNAVSFNGSYGRFAKNVNISGDFNVIGFSTFGQNVTMGSQLTVKNGINSENYISAKTKDSKIQIGGGGSSDPNAVLLNVSGGAGDGYLSLNGNNNSSVKLDIWGSQKIRGDLDLSASNDGKTSGKITTNGLSPDSHPSGWSVGLRTKDIYSSGSIGFGGDDGKLRGYMTYNKSQDKVHMFANGQLGVGTPSSAGNSGGSYSAYMNQDTNGKGQIYASGNITSSETVSGQYIQPTSTVIAGEACSPNGLISKNTEGKTLSCVSGKWELGSGISEYTVSIPYPSNYTGNYCPSNTALFAYYGRVGYQSGCRAKRQYYSGWVTPYQLSLHDSDSWGDNGGCTYYLYSISNVSKIKCG